MSDEYIKRLKSESDHFRALLPDKLWLEVIQRLLDDDDAIRRSVNFQHLINSSPYFRELKKADRAVMLMPQILQLIDNFGRRRNNDQVNKKK